MTPSSSQMAVLAQANLLGVMCGAGVDGCADATRELLARTPLALSDGLTEAMLAGFDVTAPAAVARRHLKAVG